MNRTRAVRRAERSRIISRRMSIVHTMPWYVGYTPVPGRLAKWNLKCTCAMCKQPRYSRARAKARESNDQ